MDTNASALTNKTLLEKRLRAILLSLGIAGFLAIFCLNLVVPIVPLVTSAHAVPVDHPTQKDKKWNIRRKERLVDYRDEKGKVRPKLWKKGVEHFNKMEFAAGVSRTLESDSTSDAPSAAPAAAGSFGLSGVQWIQVGPQPAFPIESIIYQGNGAMSGEVLDMAIDPRGTSDNFIYSVSNDGGVWRSLDGGVTFESKTDHMPSLSMGAIVLDPGNPSIVYAGTGNLFDGSPQNTLQAVKAVGVYRSTDMGETWSILNPGGIFTGNGIARMAMPAPNVLLVGSSSGLFKSINSGMTFGNNSPLFDNGQAIFNGDIEDIDLDVDDPDIVYVSVNGRGIFVSTDAGDTLLNNSNLFTNNNGSPEDTAGASGAYQLVRMAQAASTPAWLYATVQEDGTNPDGDSDGFLGLYRSTDSGANWTRMVGADWTGAANGGCQCGYDQTIGVDPRNHQRVYIAFQEQYLSTDGGGVFTAISSNKIHWDHHYVGFSPSTHWGGLTAASPTPMWVGTDGGVHSTSDGGATYNNFHNSTIATNLFHHIDIGRGSDANNDWTYGGTQDTGTLHSCAPGGCGAPANASGPTPWEMGNNGDGSGIAVDPINPLRAYGVRNGDYRFTNDGGQTWINPDQTTVPVPPSAWRYAIDFSDTTRVWAITGTTFRPRTDLWRSNDGTGTNWSFINTFTSNIRAIANTSSDSNLLWFGRVDGQVQKTVNATAATPTFSAPITIPGNPGNVVSEIAINPWNTEEVVVTYRGLCGACANPDNRMRRIFRTTDGGATWADISGTDGNPTGNLPNLATHSVVYDIGTTPPSIIVANDTGVLRSSNNGATWERLGLGLPVADSKMLKIDHSVNPPLLRLGTYGRSVFELAEAQGPIMAVNTDLGFDTGCISDRQTRIVQIFNVGSEPLTINAFFQAEGSTQFEVLAGPGFFPVAIQPGEEVDFTIEFAADVAGVHNAVFQINSNDQFEPAYQLAVSGTVNTQMITTLIADSGSFEDVCLANDFQDLSLTIANPGCGFLEVDSINITGTNALEFYLPGVMNYPFTVAEGNAIEVPIRFDPSGTCGDTRIATVEISNNDPDNLLRSVDISGTVPCPDVNVAIADSGDFGDVCKGGHADLDLTLFNQGFCNLNISNISIVQDGASFELPSDLEFPLMLSHDADFMLPVRYAPAECNDAGESATIVITSDDPNSNPVEVGISGRSPCPNLVIDPDDVTDLYAFPATVVDTTGSLGCYSDRTVVLRNTGWCPLTISEISTAGADYTVIAPESPLLSDIILPTGEETLEVTVRFTPQSDADPLAPSEVEGLLTVVSDDPDYLIDPTTGQAGLCGESVAQSGVRILVTDISSGDPLPVDVVDEIGISSKGKSRPGPINLRFTDQPISSTTVCGNVIEYHVDQETLPETHTTGTNPKSSYQAKAKEGNLQAAESFTLNQCEFRDFQLQLQDADSAICLLEPKGASCVTDGDCCSGKCRGKDDAKVCR